MKSKSCLLNADERLYRRLHYCGTCKTMGRLYGQKSRLFLNNDAVFLGEILSDLSGPGVRGADWAEGWADAYRSYNCLSLPSDQNGKEEMPLPLKFAATAAVMMADFKIADRIADSSPAPWKFAKRIFSKSFGKAARALREWGFPLAELQKCSQIQEEREREVVASTGGRSAGDLIDYLAEPTSKASGLFFEQGARAVNAGAVPELESQMRELGFSFGKLVYILDALEDFDKDVKSGSFNALAAAYRLPAGTLPVPYREGTRQTLLEIAEQIQLDLLRLPIPPDRARIYASRLRSNITGRLGGRLPVLTAMAESACNHIGAKGFGAPKGSVGRLRAAISVGRAMASRRVATGRSPIIARVEAPFVFASAATVGLLLPHQAASASSYKECMGMAVNLMFMGGLVRSMVSTPTHFSASNPPESAGGPAVAEPAGGAVGGEPVPGDAAQKTKRKGSGGCCDSDCCDGCTCCCDCGDCCDCCSGCDC